MDPPPTENRRKGTSGNWFLKNFSRSAISDFITVYTLVKLIRPYLRFYKENHYHFVSFARIKSLNRMLSKIVEEFIDKAAGLRWLW
jgi:hypothetical protein